MSNPTTHSDLSEHTAAVLPVVPFDQLHPDDQAERHRRIQAYNETRSRAALAAANRRKGIAEPKVGDKLYVTTTRGILRRGRAGLRFDPKSKREVEVTDLNAEDLAARQLAGASVVDVDGAEQILADDSLIVHKTNATLEDTGSLVAELAAANDANAALRAELAEARRNAGADPGDGSSSRLKAAQKVQAEFGNPPPKAGK